MLAPRTITLTTSPPWLPPSLWRRVRDLHHEFRFSKPERKVLHKKKHELPSVWAAKSFVLTDGPQAGGFWRPESAPWSVGMMDASFFPSVRRIDNCKAVQSAGSTFIKICLGYAMDRRPGSCLMAMPNMVAARKRIQDGLITMIERSPILAALLTGKEDDKASLRIKLLNMLIYAGWAGSPTSLGDFPAMYVVKDESDKWEESYTSKKEASAHDLIDKRVTVFGHDYKIWDNSTPTIEAGHIWQELLTKTQIICNFWVVCPDCETHQIMIFDQIKWPGGSQADPVTVAAEKMAYYVCHACGSEWTDRKRDLAAQKALADGRTGWRATPSAEWLERFEALKKGDHQAMDEAIDLGEYLHRYRPAYIGFHNPAWHCFPSLSESAAAFLKSEQEGLDKLKDFCNNYAAEPWKQVLFKTSKLEILALRDGRPEKMVPDWALCLVLTADVQLNGIWFEIRAHDERNTALVHYGYVAKGLIQTEDGMAGDFAGLKEILGEGYRTGDQSIYQVRFGLIDSGYRTDEVYAFCRLVGLCAPSKGSDFKRVPITYTKIDTMPGTGKLIPGGVQLVHFDANFFKDILANILETKLGDPGYWALHGETGDDYARQYISEAKNEETKTWEKKGSRPNHLWDCGVMQLVARRIMETQGLMSRLQKERQLQQEQIQTQARQGMLVPAQTSQETRLW